MCTHIVSPVSAALKLNCLLAASDTVQLLVRKGAIKEEPLPPTNEWREINNESYQNILCS